MSYENMYLCLFFISLVMISFLLAQNIKKQRGDNDINK